MAELHAKPASFEEAKELARRNMLAVQDRTDDDATQAPQQPNDDEIESVDDDRDPSVPDEGDSGDADEASTDDEDPEDDDEDDESDDEPDEADDDEDDDEDDDDEAEDPAPKPEPKRKSSRRSKKVEKLQAKIRKLESDSADVEERLLKRIQDEQARRAALEAAQRDREAEDRQIEAEMTEYLGSDEEYRSAVRAALNGDPFEAEKARTWDERREVFGKLNRRAEARVNARAAEIFWSATDGLAGVDKDVLEKADFGAVLKHLHEAGFRAAEAKAKAEIDKRDARISRLEAQVKAKKIKRAASGTKSPIEGGTPITPKPQKSIYQQAINPDGTINREKFEELKRQAARSAI